MQTYTFGLYSLSDIEHLEITIDVDGVDMNQLAIVADLKAILTGNPFTLEGSIFIAQVQESHKNNLQKLLTVYQSSGVPQINALPSYFLRKVGMGNYYAVTVNRELNVVETTAILNQIDAIQNGKSYENLMEEYEDLFSDMLLNYELHANDGEKRINIGPKDKEKRICRYCHRDSSETSFNEVAHTVSEGLGNKGIITNDECDECNGYFGKNVEPALLEYLDFFRVWYGVHGKKGKIHHKYGGNYELEKTDDNSIKLDITLTDEDIAALSENSLGDVNLRSHIEIAKQDIYRTLVKYALGILQPENMPPFEKTVEWLRGKREVKKLPIVRIEMALEPVEQPKVVTMIRKSEDETLPYAVSEIHVMNIRFLLIIPMCDEKDNHFLGNDYWERFLDVFKMYKVTNWQLQDFSETEKKQLVMKVGFVKEK